MQTKNIVLSVSVYKILINVIRICVGISLFVFGLSISRILNFLTINEPGEEHLFNQLLHYVNPASVDLTFILAVFLILISSLEVLFSIALIMRKEWGGAGLVITSIMWIPIEILFISKFLLIHKTITIIINLIIVGFLLNLIYKHRSYFKK